MPTRLPFDPTTDPVDVTRVALRQSQEHPILVARREAARLVGAYLHNRPTVIVLRDQRLGTSLQELLAQGILVAATDPDKTFTNVVNWLDGRDRAEAKKLIEASQHSGDPIGTEMFGKVMELSRRELDRGGHMLGVIARIAADVGRSTIDLPNRRPMQLGGMTPGF